MNEFSDIPINEVTSLDLNPSQLETLIEANKNKVCDMHAIKSNINLLPAYAAYIEKSGGSTGTFYFFDKDTSILNKAEIDTDELFGEPEPGKRTTDLHIERHSQVIAALKDMDYQVFTEGSIADALEQADN